MNRLALLLPLVGLALAAKLPGEPFNPAKCGKDFPNLEHGIQSDDDVKCAFTFLNSSGAEFVKTVRKEVADSEHIKASDKPLEELEEVLKAVETVFTQGMDRFFKTLLILDKLSEAVFLHQVEFKRSTGGCEALFLYEFDTKDTSDEAKLKVVKDTAVKLSEDLHCMADDADRVYFDAEFVTHYKTKEITSAMAMTITSDIAQKLIHSSEDSYKIIHGMMRVLHYLAPEVFEQIFGPEASPPSKREQVKLLLRSLLNELNLRK